MKKIVSAILCIILCIGMMPVSPARADGREDGEECWWCGHFHWGDYKCDDCGGCSSSCDNSECYAVTHCTFCGACLCYVDHCLDGLPACMQCLYDEGLHCTECGACYCYDPEPLCGNCFRCPDCVEICPECGWCYDCEEHCPLCESCAPDMCESGGDHCVECCEDNGWICPGCGECTEATGRDFCDYCGLCEECCEELQCEECGMCAEDPEYEIHFCEECGKCLTGAEVCDSCGLCAECCLDIAETFGCGCGGYCWMDVDDSHICADCGECFGVTDACDDCVAAGEYRCKTCCEINSAIAGCDCTPSVCVNSPEWDDHKASMHTQPTGEHSFTAQNTWSFDATSHWHACRWCDSASHTSAKVAHTFDANKRCTVCGYSAATGIVITLQPKDVHVNVNDESSEKYSENVTKFVVHAIGLNQSAGLHYEWHQVYNSKNDHIMKNDDSTKGANTNTITVVIPSDCCVDYLTEYYCVITDDYGHKVTSQKAKVIGRHVYEYYNKSTCISTAEGHTLQCVGSGCDKVTKLLPHNFGEWKWHTKSDGTRDYRTRVCVDCKYEEKYTVHVHNYVFSDAAELVTSENATVKGNSDTGVTITGKVTSSVSGRKIDAGMDPSFHWIQCSRSGCTMTHKETHEWGPWILTGDELYSAAGTIYRECKVCGYQDFTVKYDENGKAIRWEFGTHPVNCINCTANKQFVRTGETLVLTPNQVENKVFDHYEAEMLAARKLANGSYAQGMYVNLKNSLNGNVLTIPEYLGKGEVKITAIFKDGCTHSKTKLVDKAEPTCTEMGYSGDTVCADCGKLIKRGRDLDELGHTKEVKATKSIPKTDEKGKYVYDKNGFMTYEVLAEVSGIYCDDTSKTYYSNYTGDTICSRCGKVATKGHYTARLHRYEDIQPSKTSTRPVDPSKLKRAATCTTDGYTGDQICKGCGKVKTGQVIPATHSKTLVTKNAVAATCTKAGYTGDQCCSVCNAVLKPGRAIAKTEHIWDKGKIKQAATCSTPGNKVYTCSKCSATKTEVMFANHDWTLWSPSGESVHKRVCINDMSHIETAPHTFSGNTCTECGYVKGSKITPTPTPKAGKPTPTPTPKAGKPTPTPTPTAGKATPTPTPKAGDTEPTPTPKAGDTEPTPTPIVGDTEPTPMPTKAATPSDTTSSEPKEEEKGSLLWLWILLGVAAAGGTTTAVAVKKRKK